LVGIFAYPHLLNPFKHPLVASQIFFHKILRWFVGILMLLNAFACISLSPHSPFGAISIIYVVFGGLAALGWLFDRLGVRSRLVIVPYYFTLVNFAAAMGIVDFFRKRQAVAWKPVR
jgi:hypothetical protein